MHMKHIREQDAPSAEQSCLLNPAFTVYNYTLRVSITTLAFTT
jgi:hypothetical protein